MMREGNNFLKRSLSLVLVAVLLLSNLNGLAMLVDAADEHKHVDTTVAEIVADNYDLTDAEKALLNSGYLASDAFTVEIPDANNSDGIVAVDTDNAKITAKTYEGWVPTEAVIEYGDNEQLTVALNDKGVGTYDAAKVGNAFSVKVTYKLTTKVDAAVQNALLKAPAALKQGVANLDAIAGQAGNLVVLEEALPVLVDIATNGLSFGSVKIELEDENVRNAIFALNAQMTANNGQLELSAKIAAYEALQTKTAYLMTNGSGMLESAATLSGHIETLTTWLDGIKSLISSLSEQQKKQLNLLSGVVGNLNTALTDIAAADWSGTEVALAKEVNYAQLDALVAALGETKKVTIKEELEVAKTTVQYNLAMWNVTVNVILETVNSANEIKQYGKTHTVTLTLADGATAEEVHTAIINSKVIEDAKAAWGAVYVAEHYNEQWVDEVTGTLNADAVVYVLYTPNKYTVTIAGEAAEYPYGYKLTLPKHDDSTKAYDYYDEAGNYIPQGTVITVSGNAVYTRKEGSAYAAGTLLDIIASNAANNKLTAILSSGALTINENVNYREPDDLGSLVSLSENKLTAKTYASDYEGLYWAPYSYVVDGSENLFNGATEVTISGEFEKVEVYYRLTLNYTAADVQGVLDLVNTLVKDAAGQKSKLDALAGNTGAMASLDKTKFGALNGVIDVSDISEQMKAYFKPIVSSIIANCLDGDGKLKLYNMLMTYQDANNGGLAYYYANSKEFLTVLEQLVSYLNDMMGDNEKISALAVLMTDAGFPEYVDRLATMKEDLNALKRDLTPPNAAIDVASGENLRKLADALINAGDLSGLEAQVPYLQLGPVVKTADKYVSVQVQVVIGGNTYTVPVATVLKGGALTAEQVAALKDGVDDIISDNLGDKEKYYNNDYNNAADLNALVGKELNQSVSYTYTWTAKTYTVKIDGEDDQTVTIENLGIKLPGHPNAASGMSYVYFIDGEEYPSGSYTFTREQLDRLFVDGVLTITREEKNEAIEKLEQMVANMNEAMGYEAMVLTPENGVYTGITANLDISSLVDFVTGLVNSGYSYIGLNGEGLLYMNESNTLEVAVQTLVNAFLNDAAFGSETLIEIGDAGKGVLLNASLQLGNSSVEIQYEDLTFTINVTSVPSQFVKAANALMAVKNYVSFHSENGIMVVDLNLPDAVYGAYLTALVGTGNADKADVNAVNQQIAFEFLYDYFEAIINSDMDAETFTNTIAMLGKDVDLTKYNNYYKFFCSFMQGNEPGYGSAVVTSNEKDTTLDVTLVGKTVVDSLLNLVGKDPAELKTYLGMIKEYKAGGKVETTVKAVLENPERTYNAMIVDIQADGLTNKYACTSSNKALANKLAALSGYSAVILLDDVVGDLTISGTTILDLNGKTVSGKITSTGTLYIVDSSMDTYKAGTVTGAVSGNVVILAGNYEVAPAASCLKDGYYQDGTTVRNELYYITENNGDVTFVIDTDVVTDGNVPSVKVMAVDIAIDMVLNYVTSAALTVEGNEIYNVNFDDLLGLLRSDSKVDDVVNKVLNSVYVETGVTNVVNMILKDLLDFTAIYDALNSDGVVATYELTTNPWYVSLDHITDGNYMTVSIVSDEDISETFSVSLKLEGDNKDHITNLVGALKDVAYADATVQLYQPTYGDKLLHLVGEGKAEVIVDFVKGIGEDYDKHEDYVTIIGVILAYGNPDVAEAVKAALEANDMAAMKEIVDNTTVEEIFTALKAMSRNVDFKAMAEKVGVTVSDSAAELEAAYHLVLCAAGKALEELGIVGRDSKLGSLETSDGVYNLTKENIFRDGEVNVRSYSVVAELEAKLLSVKVILFADKAHEHVWSDWEVLSPATCCSEGVEIRRCECGEVEPRVLPKDPNAHDWSDWEVVKEAGKYTDGEEQRVCRHCHTVETRLIPRTGDFVIVAIGTLALFALLGLAYVQLVLKRKLSK